jgi:hypothetical protein
LPPVSAAQRYMTVPGTGPGAGGGVGGTGGGVGGDVGGVGGGVGIVGNLPWWFCTIVKLSVVLPSGRKGGR